MDFAFWCRRIVFEWEGFSLESFQNNSSLYMCVCPQGGTRLVRLWVCSQAHRGEQNSVKIKITDRYPKAEPNPNRTASIRSGFGFEFRNLKPDRFDQIIITCIVKNLSCRQPWTNKLQQHPNVFVWKISFRICFWHLEEYSLIMHVYTWNNKIKHHFGY